MIPRKRHTRNKGKVLENLPLAGLLGGGKESPQIYGSCGVWDWVSLVLQPASHSRTHVHTGTHTHPSSFVRVQERKGKEHEIAAPTQFRDA